MNPPDTSAGRHVALEVDAARERVLAGFAALESVETPIGDALGMVVSQDIVTPESVPPFRNSAMDGFAVRSRDTSAGGEVALAVVGSVAAGALPKCAVGPRQAIRIMTGAVVPSGADAVVRFEMTDEFSRGQRSDREVVVFGSVVAGENIRAAGEDFLAGDRVIVAGTTVGPVEIGLLASIGVASVPVHRRPIVAILSTGDEVVAQRAQPPPGKIRDSNAPLLAALVRRAGGIPKLLGIAGDSSAAVLESLRAAEDVDLVITTGGVSIGDYDVVKNVLQDHGEIALWQVQMKPGRPLAFGRVERWPILGLPGNPAAVLVSFLQFGRPIIWRMLGRRDVILPEVTAILSQRIENPGGRRLFARGVITWGPGTTTVHPVGRRDPSVRSIPSGSNCLIVIPESTSVVEAGESVHVQLVDVDSY